MKDIVDSNKYSEMLELQSKLNGKLCAAYEANKAQGREHLSSYLVNYVEQLVDELNAAGYDFGRCDYGGDKNFENSEQSYCDGEVLGTGIILSFLGFSVQVSWEGRDRYT